MLLKFQEIAKKIKIFESKLIFFLHAWICMREIIHFQQPGCKR
jgi:hypothetical protein